MPGGNFALPGLQTAVNRRPGKRSATGLKHLKSPQETPYMKNATFYLLDNDTQQDGLSAVEQLVCDIAAERWRAGLRVLIACEDEQQAIRLDEALWARPPESFVPHNLAGEGPRGGAPVEIAWPQKRNSSPRDILISLRSGFADFATAFTEVIDFVPHEDSLKQLARERYKAYRLAGFNLNTATWK